MGIMENSYAARESAPLYGKAETATHGRCVMWESGSFVEPNRSAGQLVCHRSWRDDMLLEIGRAFAGSQVSGANTSLTWRLQELHRQLSAARKRHNPRETFQSASATDARSHLE